MAARPPECCGITRRGFLVGAGAGLAAGASLAWLGLRGWQGGAMDRDDLASVTRLPVTPARDAMPGRFPGRVIEIRHPGAVDDRTNAVRPQAVKSMIDRGMCELTGAEHPTEAWRSFFEPGDVVGIKVNPVGMKGRADAIGVISSPEVLIETVEGLKSAGVLAKDIIVFERYASEFRSAGYERVLAVRALDGVRWYASSSGYDPSQLNIDGHVTNHGRADIDPHVVGYDPDVFVHMGFAAVDHDPRDDRRFRSHLSVIVTRMVNKIVTIPALKDHRSAGITGALKNLSHGLNNNVARSHLPTVERLAGAASEPNQCATFIPTAAGQRPIREKATLHILDGLIGAYEGGPGCWNPTWATWRRKSLFFATDPVAMDHVAWQVIDAKRTQEGWPPVARMGILNRVPAVELAGRLAALGAHNVSEELLLAALGQNLPGDQETEQFDRRQPEHVILAGTIGLGIFDARRIDQRSIEIGA